MGTLATVATVETAATPGTPGAGDIEDAQRRRWLILPVLCLSVFLVVVDNTIVNVALPTLNRELGASITGLQWIVDAYSLAFAGLLLAGGGIGDRLGRKGTMQVGLVFFGLFSVAAAVSHSTGTLIGARALMGVAAAFIFPASLAILTSVFTDPSERQKALGIWGATSGIAVAFGPVTGGALLQHFWYGSIFLVNVPIVVVTLIAGQRLIPRLPKVAAGRFDTKGVLVSTAGVTSLVLGIIEGPQWGWMSPGTLICFAMAAVLLTGFTIMELRTEHPLLDVRVFRIPRFTGGAVSISVAFFCLFGFIFLITQYFQFVKGYSTLSAGLHTLPFAVVAAIATPLGRGHCAEARHSHRRGDGFVPHGRRADCRGLQLRGDDRVLGADHPRHDPARARAVLHHGADDRGGDGFRARRAARCGGRREQHHEGARRHTGSRRLRVDLRLVLCAADHQRLPIASDPARTEGSRQPIHGRCAVRGRSCTQRGAALARRHRRHGVPQRTSRGLHRRCRCCGSRRGRRVPAAPRTAIVHRDRFGNVDHPALRLDHDRGAHDRRHRPSQSGDSGQLADRANPMIPVIPVCSVSGGQPSATGAIGT